MKFKCHNTPDHDREKNQKDNNKIDIEKLTDRYNESSENFIGEGRKNIATDFDFNMKLINKT